MANYKNKKVDKKKPVGSPLSSTILFRIVGLRGLLFMKGWITLHRRIEENELWLSEPFTKGQAWVDLIMLANHKQKTLWKRGIKVVLNRGEVGWSEEKLAKRWRWSRGKVRRFLKYLKTVQQIEQQNNRTLSRIIIKNYSKYQQDGTTDGTTDGTINNNVNNVNNKGEVNLPAKKDMAWNKYNENAHTNEVPVVDMDTGEEEVEKKPNTPNRKRMDELVDWMISHQGRDKLRTNRPKQYKALKELVKMKVTGKEAQDILVEETHSPYWKGKKENPDFSTVVSIIQRRG